MRPSEPTRSSIISLRAFRISNFYLTIINSTKEFIRQQIPRCQPIGSNQYYILLIIHMLRTSCFTTSVITWLVTIIGSAQGYVGTVNGVPTLFLEQLLIQGRLPFRVVRFLSVLVL